MKASYQRAYHFQRRWKSEPGAWIPCASVAHSPIGDGFTASYCSTSTTAERKKRVAVLFNRIEYPKNTFICDLRAFHMSRATYCHISHFILFYLLIFLQFHYYTFSFLFSISMVPAFLLLIFPPGLFSSHTLYSFITPTPPLFFLPFHIYVSLIASLSATCPILTPSFLFGHAAGHLLTLPHSCTMPEESSADRPANA